MSCNTNRLDEIADVIDSLHKTPQYSENGYPMVRATDVKYGYLNLENTLRVQKSIFEEFSRRYIPNKDDIVITRVGSYGITSLVKDTNFCLGQNTSVIVPKINARYLYFALNSSYIKNQIENSVVGSTQKTLSLKAINSLEIPRFNEETEKKIAHILSVLDDKIELNRKMNQTLESMASEIFKSWFVNFDPVHAKANCEDEAELENIAKELGISKEILDLFPSEFIESELGMIPKGWEVKKAGDFTNTFDYVANGSFASLKENVTLYDEPNDILYVRTTDFNNGFKGSLKYTDKNSYDFLKKSKLLGHETIISNVADVGTIFRAPVWLGLPMTLGSNAIGVVGLDNEFLDSYIFYFFKSQIGQHLIESITTGSAQLKFNKTSFRALNILVPNIEIRNIFEKQEKLIYEKIVNNVAEIETLQKTRDTLLPKLLSGEIDVSELEIL